MTIKTYILSLLFALGLGGAVVWKLKPGPGAETTPPVTSTTTTVKTKTVEVKKPTGEVVTTSTQTSTQTKKEEVPTVYRPSETLSLGVSAGVDVSDPFKKPDYLLQLGYRLSGPWWATTGVEVSAEGELKAVLVGVAVTW
jgi:hypothetical protein